MNKKKVQLDYTQGQGWREQLVLKLLDLGGWIHYYLKPKQQPWGIKAAELNQYPQGSLGKCLGEFYRQHGFEPVARAERHDVFHVLLGYTTCVQDEANMQFFLWGNGKTSPFTVGTCLICLLVFAEHFREFFRQFRQGRRYRCISEVDFLPLLGQNADAVKLTVFKYR